MAFASAWSFSLGQDLSIFYDKHCECERPNIAPPLSHVCERKVLPLVLKSKSRAARFCMLCHFKADCQRKDVNQQELLS